MSTEEGEKTKPKVDFPEGGKFDADGFWIMPEGDFYDPDGVHFSKDGKDQFGGYYDKQGYYVQPPQDKQEQNKQKKPTGHTKHNVFFPLIEGAKFNQAGFYELENGAFYDPLGNYFDQNGYDAMGGYYNENGEYQQGQAKFNEEDEQEEEYEQQKQLQLQQQQQQQERMYRADPDIVYQKRLEIDQEIQQTHDQAREHPGLCGNYIKKEAPPQVDTQQKESEQDDEDGVVVKKVTIKKQGEDKEKEAPVEKNQK